MCGLCFKTALKGALRNRQNLFWILLFPIILGTLFHFAFGSIYSQEKIQTIKTALVSESDEASEKQVTELLSGLEYENGDKLMEVKKMTSEDALQALKNGDVVGVITVKNTEDLRIAFAKNGLSQSILTGVITSYHANVTVIQYVMKNHPEKMQEIQSILQESVDASVVKDIGANNKDPFVSYFYNIIAMVAFMSGMAGLTVPLSCQANLSNEGARVNVSPANKYLYELSSLAAIYLVETAVLVIAVTFFIFGLGVDFGTNPALVYGTGALAMLVGVTMGFFIGHIGNMKQSLKEAILLMVSLLGGFLAGLMYGDMKFIIDEKLPWFNKINPSAIVVNAFSTLNNYGVGQQYYHSLIVMGTISVVFIILGLLLSRRKSYASL